MSRRERNRDEESPCSRCGNGSGQRGLERGLEKGREAGVIEGKRRTLLRQLSAKFGKISGTTRASVETMSEADLDSLLERVLTASTLDELGLGD